MIVDRNDHEGLNMPTKRFRVATALAMLLSGLGWPHVLAGGTGTVAPEHSPRSLHGFFPASRTSLDASLSDRGEVSVDIQLGTKVIEARWISCDRFEIRSSRGAAVGCLELDEDDRATLKTLNAELAGEAPADRYGRLGQFLLRLVYGPG
jgi:hypothetical protein